MLTDAALLIAAYLIPCLLMLRAMHLL